MAVNDPIADMLSRIRNAHQALHDAVPVPKSKLKESVSGILKEQGYINEVQVGEKDITLTLKYKNGKPLISGLKRISKPGRRVYVSAGDIPRVQNGLGICVLSTSRGLLEGETARNENVGGELLFEVW
jgi:small subunit ribosomal protein S8